MSMSLKIERLLRNLDKAYTGEICKIKDWDIKVIPQTVRAKLKKYGLEKTYDPNSPINLDDELADSFFKAGYELALEIGLLCEETERIIRVDAEEMEEVLNNYPSKLLLGAGDDEVVMKARNPEDSHVPVVIAPLALMASEENIIPILSGIAKKKKLVDVLNGLTFHTVAGRELRSGTPYETFLGHYEQEIKRHVLWLVDRENMGTMCVSNSTTEYGHLGGAAFAPGKKPQSLCLLPAEMKVCFGNFHRAIEAFNYGHSLHVGSNSYIGGYAGSVEACVLANIANELLEITIMQGDNTGNNVFDMKYFGGTSRRALWANSLVTQAMSRNTNIMSCKILDTVGGPCTEFYMYEAAVGLMINSVSGASATVAPRSAGGRFVDYVTPVEAWWCGQVFKSCAGMSRKEAKEIALKLLPKYEEQLASPPQGKSFRECYDVIKNEPTEEYKALYKRIETELIEMGMPLKRVFDL